MTILITVLRNDFILSVADRRSSVQKGNDFVPQDERFNKHIYFACCKVRATATYTGVAQWINRSRKSITTDYILGNTLSSMANIKANFGTTLYYIAHSINQEMNWLKSSCKISNPTFTIAIAGFSELFNEPFISIITNTNEVPDLEKANYRFELPSPSPFKIYLGVFSVPFVFIGGFISSLPKNTVNELYRLLRLPHIQAYDIANFAVSSIRKANKNSSAVGYRASAVILPANGWLDTGLWDYPNDSLYGAIPRMVLLDGRQWQPSEMKIEFEDVYIGEFQKHSLFFQSLSEDRMRNKIKRKFKKFRSSYQAPTIFQLIGQNLYGPWGQVDDSSCI